MKAHLAKVSLALLCAVFLLGCQDLGSEPVGPDTEIGGPNFEHQKKNPKPHGGGPTNDGGAKLDLKDGMVTMGLDVSVGDGLGGMNRDFLDHTIEMHFTAAFVQAGDKLCTVIRGSNGETHGDTLSDADWTLLQDQLTTNSVTSGTFTMIIEPTGLVAGGRSTTGGHYFLIEYDRGGEFPFRTQIGFGGPNSDIGPVTVQWISSADLVDVFEFTGPVVVSAKRVDGSHSRKSNRTMACEEANPGDNLMTVTLDRSPA